MKGVVFDLDDTLLHDDLTISDFSVRVFRKLRDTGYSIIPASGRAQLSMKPYVDQLGCVAAYISCNGAEIWEGASHKLIHQELFSSDIAIEIARFGEKHSCYAQVYQGDSFYYNQYDLYAERYAAATKLHGVYAGKLSDFIHEPRNKILMMADESKITMMYAEAKELFSDRASVTCSKPWYLEFNPLQATKGNALRFLASYLGFGIKDIIAFGDSLNDLSMLQSAGLSVTVSNGWEAVRPYCDFVCDSNNQDGPAHFLNEHFLSGEVI